MLCLVLAVASGRVVLDSAGFEADDVTVGYQRHAIRNAGVVWVDDVRPEPVEKAASPNVEIDLSRRGPAPIDAKQCGQFIEPLCNMLPSAIAQQVAGDSFEEEPPWSVAFRPEIDRPHRLWYPSGAVHVARYALDTEKPFNGRRSQKIEIGVAHARAGISQDGFYTQAGVGYRLSLNMRGSGDVRVFAALHGDGGTIAGPVELGAPGADWKKAAVALKAMRTCNNGTLTIEAEGPGTLWLDRVYFIGDDAVLGLWRPDLVAALKALNPGIVRFGGSTIEEFNWQDCIGSWDRRAPYPVAPWGGLEANFAGPEELVQLCRHIGAEPLLCVRWSGRTPDQVAAEVEYYNGAADTPMGRRRAANGHPEPYGVKYWQIGNEVGGDEYNESLAAFARAMKAADPSIKLITSFGRPDLRKFGGGLIDYTSKHDYGCDNLRGLRESYDALRGELRGLPGGPVRLAVTEWNTTGGDWGLGRNALLTLGNALSCARYHNLIQRYADVVEIANRSNLCDSFCSGVIQTGPGWLYLAPTYYVQQLYSRAAGSSPLEPRDASGVEWPMQAPDISAALSADGRTLRIYAVNSTLRPIEVTFRLTGTTGGVKTGTVYVVRDRDRAPTAEVQNTRDDPQRITTTTRPAEPRGAAFRYTFEPLSVTLLELELEN
jgi:alpha-N-arabinofuranosidase